MAPPKRPMALPLRARTACQSRACTSAPVRRPECWRVASPACSGLAASASPTKTGCCCRTKRGHHPGPRSGAAGHCPPRPR
eukprot:6305132-Prymnesium_polylepis.1